MTLSSKLFRSLYSFFRPGVSRQAILVYHHFGLAAADPWKMYVSAENFNAQLQVLKEDYVVLPLSAYPLQHARKTDKPIIFLSIDDGYLDFYQLAYPLLKELNLPATLFLCTKTFTESGIYWWEVLEEIFLGKYSLPPILQVQVNGQHHQWSLEDQNDESLKLAIYFELSAIAKSSSVSAQQELVNTLMEWSGIALTPENFPKLDKQIVTGFLQEGLVEIGAHTSHHPALGMLTKEAQWEEIATNKHALESLFSREITAFSYPHGHYNTDTPSLVREAGFKLACTTEEGICHPGTDPFRLPRIWVQDWNSAEFSGILKNWFNA